MSVSFRLIVTAVFFCWLPSLSFADEVYVPTSFGEIHVTREGSESAATTFLLVHGVTDDTTNLDPLTAELVATGRANVIRLDLLGHGKTLERALSGGATAPYEIEVASQGEMIGEVVAALDLRDFVLVGHSYGGAAAVAAASRVDVAARLRAVHLLAPFVYRIDHANYHEMFPLVSWDTVVRGVYPPVPTDLTYEWTIVPMIKDFCTKRYYEQFGFDPRSATPEQKSKVSTYSAFATAVTRGMRWFYTATEIAKIPRHIPIAMTVAEKDQLTKINPELALSRAIKRNGNPHELTVLPKVGHRLPIEAAKTVARLLTKFASHRAAMAPLRAESPLKCEAAFE